MPCYCGVATRAGTLKWTCFFLFLGIGWACFIAIVLTEGQECEVIPHAQECQQHPYAREDCKVILDEFAKCVRGIAPLLQKYFLAWMLSWFIASVILCSMCCCSVPPQAQEDIPQVAAAQQTQSVEAEDSHVPLLAGSPSETQRERSS